MKIIENGNFVRWFRELILLVGIALGLLGLNFEYLPKIIRLILFLAGIVLACIGGYSSQANTLRLKLFDNSYKKARKSYQKKED